MADISKVNVNSADYDLKDQKSRDALVDVVDDGAKNLSQFNSGTAAADNVTLATGVPLVGLAGEVLVFSYETTLSSGIITVGFKDANGNATGSVEIGNATKQKIVTIPEDTAKFNIFVSKAGTYTNFMVCTKAEWDISNAFVPYGKTNAELTNDTSTLFTENTRQETEIGVVANAGAKNLLNLSSITPTVPSGLTLTDNNDGTFSVSGTLASANSIMFPIDAISGNLILSGCPSGGGESSYMLRLTKSGTAVSASTDTGGGSQIFSMDGTEYALAARFAAGTYTNVTFKPMIRPASITDPTFQPFALPNPVITPALIEQVDNGAKNVLYYTKVGTSVESGSQYLSNGVRFTMQSDGSVLVNRESSNVNEAFCNLRLDSSSQFIDDFCNGQYVLSGSYGNCILRATNNTYNVIDSDGSGVVLQDRGAQTSIWVQIRVAASASPNNVTIKPMICTKADWDISQAYVPYGKTNAELTIKEQANENNILSVQTDNDDNFNRSGYKNLSTVYTGTGAGGSFIVRDTPITLPAGDYVVTFKSTATSSNGSINFKDGSSIVQTITFANSSVVTKEITITRSTITTFNIYSNAATTYSDIMICTKSDYIKSNTFVKHALSNAELTAAIQALQAQLANQ